MNYQGLLSNFLQSLEKNGKAESTQTAYKKDLEQFNNYLEINKININSLTPQLLNNYSKYLKDNFNFSSKTISRKYNSLKTFLKYLFNKDLINNDIAKDIVNPKYEKTPIRVLTILEYRAIRDTARYNTKYYTIIETLLQTGLRIGELQRLKIKDINLNSDIPTLTVESYSTIKSRTIELNSQLKESLEYYYFKYINSFNFNSSHPLFYTKNKSPILIRNLRTILNNIFKKASINNITVNDLRNTFIYYQLKEGVSIHKVSEVVGHKRLTTTEEYLKLIEDKPKRIIKKLISL